MIVSVKGKRPKGDVAKEMSLTGKLVIAGGSAIVLILVISAHRQEGGRRP